MLTKSVTAEISRLLDVYCEECPIKQDLRARSGKTSAHHFCIETCSVGKQLRFIGNQLNDSTQIKP